MRIAIIGAGGVGGYFGGCLARAGNHVTFAARGRHGEAIRTDGLNVHAPDETFTVHPQLHQGGEDPHDIILIAVKMYDFADAIEAALPLGGPETIVVPLQNGVEATDMLAKRLAPQEVAGGVAAISAFIEAPGVVRRVSPFARLQYGMPGGAPSPLLDRFSEACVTAGIDHAQVGDIELAVWRKFIFLAPFATITCLARLPIGPIRDDPALWERFATLVREAAAVGHARGVPLPADAADKQIEYVRSLPYEMKASMLGDLENGRRLELDWLSGAVIRLGEATGVATPVTRESDQAIRRALATA